MTVYFMDTTVLCNLIPVPGRDQHRSTVLDEFKARQQDTATFVLPITAVIETGNFIAQLSDGRERRATARLSHQLLGLICENKAPWVLHDVQWNCHFLQQFLDGAGTESTMVELAASRLGAGDLCILTERRVYRARAQLQDVQIWTLDEQLLAHN